MKHYAKKVQKSIPLLTLKHAFYLFIEYTLKFEMLNAFKYSFWFYLVQYNLFNRDQNQ